MDKACSAKPRLAASVRPSIRRRHLGVVGSVAETLMYDFMVGNNIQTMLERFDALRGPQMWSDLIQGRITQGFAGV